MTAIPHDTAYSRMAHLEREEIKESQERRRVQDRLDELLSKVVDRGTTTDCVAQNADIVPELQQILASWKESKGTSSSTPHIMLCLLDHTYPSDRQRVPTLRGADAHKLALLQALATPLEFYFGFATFIGEKWEPVEDNEPDWDDSFENFIDLDGSRISYKLNAYEDETIPQDFHQAISDGPFIKETYAGVAPNAVRKREYRRTFLVIWPSWSNFEIRYPGKKGFKRALAKINSMATTRKGPPPDTGLIDNLLACPHKGVRKIACALCDLACRLNSPELWNKVVISCDADERPAPAGTFQLYDSSDEDDSDDSRYSHSTELGFKEIEDLRFEDEYYEVSGEGYYSTIYNTERVIPTYKIIAAVKQFGFQAVRPGLEHMLEKDTFNGSRLLFLEHLEKRAVGGSGSAANNSLREWCAAEKLRMFTSLKETEATRMDIRLFFAVAKAHGGIDYLKDHMLSHIIRVVDSDVLLEFASDLDGGATFPPSDAKSDVVSQLVKASIAKEPFYDTLSDNSRGKPADLATVANLNQSSTRDFVSQALGLGGGHLLHDILERIMQVNESLEGVHAAIYTAYVMLSLIPFLEEIPRDIVDMTSNFEAFREKTIFSFLDHLQADLDNKLLLDELMTLVDAALACRDGELFIRSVWPRIRRLKLPMQPNQKLHGHILCKSERIASIPDEKLDASLRSELAVLSRYCSQVTTVSSIMAAIDFASKAEDSTALIEGIITSAISSTTATHVEGVLVPLISKLQEWALKHHTNLDYLVRKIVVVCIEQMLGPAPPPNPTLATQLSQLTNWLCTCAPCRIAREFLIHSEEQATRFRIMGGPRVATHVCEYLSSYVAGLATWDVVRDRKVWFTMTKSDVLHQLIRRQAQQKKGTALVQSLGRSEDDVRRILGSEYERVRSMLDSHANSIETNVMAALQSQAPRPAAKSPPVQSDPRIRSSWTWQGHHGPATKKRRF